MVAQNDIRAERRYKELVTKGESVNLEEVKKSIARRDYLDMNRDISPLRKANDAIEIDNSELSEVEQMELALGLIQDKIKSLETAN
jgi:cytidylate kinase